MPITKANGIDLCYETVGDVNDPTLLLVHGFTAQVISWEEGFVRALADRGLRVVIYDNRDVGQSTHFDGVHVNLRTVAAAVRSGEDAGALVPYTLSDMAADGVGLLDVLGVERAHVAGASMGGMIAQTIAIEHPERTRSLASIMSTTGESSLRPGHRRSQRRHPHGAARGTRGVHRPVVGALEDLVVSLSPECRGPGGAARPPVRPHVLSGGRDPPDGGHHRER